MPWLLFIICILTLCIIVSTFVGYFIHKKHILQQNILKKSYHEQKIVIENQKISLEECQKKNVSLIAKIAQLETENIFLEKKNASQEKENEKEYKRINIQFKNIANSILEDNSKKFTAQNQLNINNILKPLAEKIFNFEKKIYQTHQESLEKNAILRTEIKQLNELNQKITHEANSLTRAIKGDQRLQGNWGEFILESILEKSGLEKGREYTVQENFITLEGKKLRPDVIIKLPENKCIIIDAKLSLVHYEKYFNATEDKIKENYLSLHLQSIKNHIKNLSQKNYADEYNIQNLDFVLLFIPLEPAFSLAIQQKPTLFSDAYDSNIVLVSPTTLIATLKTIASIWKSEYQNQNAIQIAKLGGSLYDKFVGFIQDLQHIGKQIDTTKKYYDEASKKLYTGKDNIIKKIERLDHLGVKSTKKLKKIN